MLFGQDFWGKKGKKSSVEKRTVIVVVVVVFCPRNGPYQKKPAKVVREEEDEEDEEDDVSREGVSFFCVSRSLFSRKKERERENATNLEREKTNALV